VKKLKNLQIDFNKDFLNAKCKKLNVNNNNDMPLNAYAWYAKLKRDFKT